jgi:hypothetical protein
MHPTEFNCEPKRGREAASIDETVVVPLGPLRTCAIALDRPAFLAADGDATGLELRFGSVLLSVLPVSRAEGSGQRD